MTSAAIKGDRALASEHRPADVVASPLIVNHQRTDRIRELLALPIELEATGQFLTSRSGCTCGPDGVGGGTEVMLSDMAHAGSLTCRVGGMPSGSSQLPCSTHGMATGCTGLHHLHLSPRPRTDRLDRVTRPCVGRAFRLEEVQNVLGAGRRPKGDQAMVEVRERSPATDGDEARVTLLRQNHDRNVGRRSSRGRRTASPIAGSGSAYVPIWAIAESTTSRRKSRRAPGCPRAGPTGRGPCRHEVGGRAPRPARSTRRRDGWPSRGGPRRRGRRRRRCL